MRKKIIVLTLIFSHLILFSAKAQQYSVFETGVNGVFNNPANIAGNPYRFDVNLFSLNAMVANNQKIDFSDLSKDSLFYGNSIDNLNLFTNLDFYLPSFSIAFSPRTAMAITTRARVINNISNFDPNIIGSIIDISDGNIEFPYEFSYKNAQNLNLNVWGEVGVSLAHVFINTGEHVLKAGLTAKYLLGAGNVNLKIDNLNGCVNADENDKKYLSNAQGDFSIVSAGLGFDYSNKKFKDYFDSSVGGFGGDFGIVYEYKPLMDMAVRSSLYNYRLKLGLSLLDVGKIKYKTNPDASASYAMDIADNESLNLSQFDDKNLEEIIEIIDENEYFTNKTQDIKDEYEVKLPTTLRLVADYYIGRGFYTQVNAQYAFKHDEDDKSVAYPNSISFVPRYEQKMLGIYLPVSYNDFTKFNAGFGLRLGPLFVMSNSILSATLNPSQQFDIQVGIRFGGFLN